MLLSAASPSVTDRVATFLTFSSTDWLAAVCQTGLSSFRSLMVIVKVRSTVSAGLSWSEAVTTTVQVLDDEPQPGLSKLAPALAANLRVEPLISTNCCRLS